MPDLIQNLRDGLARYQADKQIILTNRELTQEAKLKREAALTAERLEALTRVGVQMWRALEADFNQAESAVRSARQAANAKWDFGRLMYESRAVESLLAGVRDLAGVAEIYDRLGAEGDPYRRRAFAETAPALLSNLSPQGYERARLSGFVGQLKRDAEAIARTPAVERAEEEAGQVVDRILAAREATKTVLDTFGIGGGVFGTAGRLQPLASWYYRRVAVNQKMIRESGADRGQMRVEVEFRLDPSPSE